MSEQKHTPSVRDNLIAAKALIGTPEKWRLAGDLAPNALTILGALNEVGAGEDVYMALTRQCGGMPLSVFNNHPATTHADIMALFDRAIAAQDAP